MTVTSSKVVSQETSPMDRLSFRTEHQNNSLLRSKRSTQFSRSTNHGYRPYRSYLTSFRILIFFILLISCCGSTHALSEINLASSTPIIIQEGNQVSISLIRSGTSEELESTSTLLAVIGGEGASEDFTAVNVAAFFNQGDAEATIVIAAVQDTVPEIDELFTFQLQTSLGSNIGSQNSRNITILLSDEPYGVVSFALTSLNAISPEPSETDANPTLTVVRVGAFGEVNVEWRLFGDTSGDFTQTQGVVTFPDQVDSVDLELPAARDDILEPDESFQIQLLSVDGGARLSSSNTITNLTVTLNDIPVYVSCSQSAVMESVGVISCDITRGRDSNGNSVGTFPIASSLTISTQDITASSQFDYLAIDTSVTLDESTSSYTVELTILDDTIAEDDETFRLRLIDPSSDIHLFSSVVDITIIGNDGAGGVVSILDADDFIGMEGQDVLLTLFRTESTVGIVTVSWEVIHRLSNSSSADEDILTPGSSSIPDGQSQVNLLIPVVADELPEAAEYFTVQLTSVTSNIGRLATTGLTENFIVRDSDNAYGLLEWAEVGHTITLDPRTLSLQLIRRQGLEYNILINYNVTYVPASGDLSSQLTDYVIAPGFTVIQDGVNVTSIHLTIADNAFLETQGRFYATIQSVSIIRTDSFPSLLVEPPSSPSIGPRDKLFIPIPDEAINGRIGFTDASRRVTIDEGTSSQPTNVTLTIERDGSAGQATISYVIVPATSTDTFSEDDLLQTTLGTIVLAEGETSIEFGVSVRADDIPELEETFVVTLLSIAEQNQQINGASSSSYVTIRASDTPGGIISLSATSLGPFVVSETTSEVVTLSLVRTGALLTTEIVSYSITSRGPADFFASGFEVLSANENTKVFVLTPFDDDIPELREDFTLTLLSVSSSAVLAEPTQALFTILENDYPYGVFQFQDLILSGAETGPNVGDTSQYNIVRFRVNRDRGTFGNVSVDWSFVSSSAGDDVTPTSGTLYFSEGEDYSEISIYILPDDIPENEETLMLQLSSPTGGAVIQNDRDQTELSILANDDPITFTFHILDVDESQDSRAEVTITRGGQAIDRATVRIRTTQDSAFENEDYIPYDELVVFEVGEREKTVSTAITDDNIPEIEERFYFVIYNPTGDIVVATPYNVSVYIAPNDDPYGIVSFHPQSLIVTEEEGEATELVIRRTRGVFGQLLITLSLVLASTGHSDLPVSLGDLSFSRDVIMQAGSANATFTIQVVDDGIPELEDVYYISISCPVSGFPPINPGPSCAADNLTSTFTVPENDYPYGGYGWSEDSSDTDTPEDLLPGDPPSSRDRVLFLSQYGGTLAGAEMVWELTPSLLRGYPLLDLFFYGSPGTGVSQYTGRPDTGTMAYLFSGLTDSLLTVPSQYQPAPSDTEGGFTLSGFLRGSATSGYLLVSQSADSSNLYYGVKIRVSETNSYLQYQYTVTSSSSVNTVEAELPADAFNDAWSHFAVIHRISPTRQVVLYFGGEQLATAPLMSGSIPADSSAVMTVGADGAGNEGVSLALQDVRLYYAALSTAQIQAISSSSPSQDVSPISGYSSFSIGQYNASTAVFRVKEDSIPEPTEVVYPTILNLKGPGVILPEGTTSFNILASDTGNGVFEFQSLQPVVIADESVTASIAISRSFSNQGGVYVHWSVYRSDSVTLATGDFSEVTGRVLLSDGETLADLILTPVDDTVPELAETFVVVLTGLSGEDGTTPSTPTSAYYINTPPEQNVSLRIQDNDSPYGLFQFDTSGVPVPDNQFVAAATTQPVISVSEESVNISIQVVRAQGTVGETSVEYFTSSLDASGIGADRDYINTLGKLTFTAGQRSQFLTVTLVNDPTPELSESFQVILSNPTGSSGKPSLGVGSTINITIQHSDEAFGVLSFLPDSLSRVVSEDDVSTTLYLQRTGGLLADVTLTWVLVGSNGPTDISPSGGTIYFAEGVGDGEIQFSIIPDELSEFLETFQVQLVNVTGGARLSSLGDTQATISIQASDYPHGLFNFPLGQRAVTVQEGSNFSLTINRHFGTTGDIRVYYSTSVSLSSPASPGQDYTAVQSAYVDFTSGVTTRMIEIEVLQDSLPEADERFDVQLVSAELLSTPQPGMPIPTIESGATSNSEITISENDDAKGIFSFVTTQLMVPEPASSFLYVQRRAGLFGTVSVSYTVTLATASFNDLSSLSGQVSFTEGTSLVALPLRVSDDLTAEFDETFTVSLTSPTGGARISSSNFSVAVTILENDDIHGVFEFVPSSIMIDVEEPLSIPLTVALVLERFEGAEGAVRITWEAMLRSGESAADDISVTSGELLYQSQERVKTFSIQIQPDTIPEGLEAVEVMIASVTGGARAGDASTATINILPNDAPHGVVSLNTTLFVILEEEEEYIARIPLKREFGQIGDLQITYNTTQLSILYLAFTDPSITEDYYFTGPQSLVLTGAQDMLQESDVSGSSSPFRECARLCIASYSCASLSHSTTSCILYTVVSSQTITSPSSRSYYEKISQLTDPLRQSIATDGGDYIGTTSADIVIPDGEDIGYIEIRILPDDVPEFGELFGVTLTSLSLLNISVTNPLNIPSFGDPVEARVEIARSDFPNGLFRVSLAGGITSLVIQENYTDLIIGAIYREHGTLGTVSVHYSLVGTATSVSDFALAEATFVFNPGESQKPISFFIEEDNVAEGDETIIIQLDEPTGGAEIIEGVGSRVTVQIDANDNGGGIISFAIDSLSSVIEEDRTNPIRIIRKVGSAGQALVTWVLTGYRVEQEFTSTNGTALFEDGLAYTFIYLSPRNDTLAETPQVYTLGITGVTSVDIAQTGGAILDPDPSLLTAVITLAESDMPHGVVELTSSQTVYTQGEGDTSTILVSRKFGVVGDIRLSFVSEVGNLTALNEEVGPGQRALASQSDLTPGIQSVTIPENVTSLVLPLIVIADDVPEFAEVFILRLVGVELLDPPDVDPTALKPPTLGDNLRAEIFVPQNDGPQGTLQFSLGRLEVEEDTGVLNISFSRVGGSYGPASCRVELTGVPSNLPIATRDTDYVFKSVSFSWSDGELGSRVFELEVLDDTDPESREAIYLGLTSELPSGVIRGENATLTVVILGSDLGRGVFSIDPSFPEVSIVLEGTVLMIPVQRSFSSLGEVMLQYRVLPTVLPADLSPALGQSLFQDGQTDGYVTLQVVADGVAELVEQFVVEILPPVSPEGTLLGDRTNVSVHVSESDNPYGRFQVYLLRPDGQMSLGRGLVEEDADLIQIVIAREDGLNQAVSVDWELSPVSAASNSAGQEYTLSTTQRLSTSSDWLSFYGNEAGTEFAISVDGHISLLYSWRGVYELVQTFSVTSATSWHSFSWNNIDYLVVSSYTSSIQLFQYNSTSLSYTVIQSISQARASHLLTFSTDVQLYLFACIFSDVTGNTDTNSLLYEWDSTAGLFSEQIVQQVVTRGARQAVSFESDNTRYLIVANSYDTAQQTADTPSTLYQWSAANTRFERISSINTNAAQSLSLAADTDGTLYLLVTNSSSLFVFSWTAQSFTPSQLLMIPGTVNTIDSVLFNSVLYTFVSVTGGGGMQAFTLSSGVFTQLSIAATPVISCLDVSLVEIDNQLFVLTAVEGFSQSLVLTLGSWSEDADFFQRRGTSYFSPGQSTLTLLVQIFQDDIPEVTEEFVVQLSNPTNNAVVDVTYRVLTVRILTNDDAHGLIGFSPDSLSVVLPELSSQDTARQQDFTLNVERLGGTFGDVVVRFSVTGEAVEDISLTGDTITFMSGMNTTTLPIRVINDNTIELAELATVTLTEIVSDGNTDPDVSSSMAAQINPVTSSAAVTIQANDYPHGLLTFAPSSRSVTVDEPGTGNLTSVTLTIIREYGTLGAISIEIETQVAYTYPPDQQAQLTQDFSLSTSQATMLSGVSVATVTVSVLPDLTPEITETFWVRIVSASLMDESDRQGSMSDSPRPKNSSLEVAEVNIRPNDEFRGILIFAVTLAPDGSLHTEESAGNIVLYVNRTSGNFGEIGANWRLESITSSPTDYTPSSGILSYADGQAVDTIEFRITDDPTPEMATSFRVLLFNPVGGARLGDTELIITIDESDDVHGLFYFAEGSESFSLQEPGENATQPSSATLVVLRTKGMLGEVIISWEVEAAASGDVTPLSGQLVFPENSTSADFEVSLVNDSIPELEVFYQVRLVSATNGGNIAEVRSVAYLYILPNDNPTGRISISANTRYVVVEEGSSVQVTLLRSQGAFYRVSVQWRIVPEDGSVTATQHFLTSSGTAVFDISATSTAIDLQTITDGFPESAEVFTLELLSASIAGSNERPVIETGADEATLVVAASDQPHGRIVFQSPYTSSSQESDSFILIAVLRDLGTVGDILVNFTVSTATSVLGQDYFISKYYLVIDHGQTSAYINVTLIDDPTPELSEVLQFTLTNVALLDPQDIVTLPPGAYNPGNVEINIPPVLGTNTIHTLTIEESDDPYGIIEFSQSVYSVSEGQLSQIRVNRLMGTIGVQSVQFIVTEGRATLGEDFNTGSGTLIGTLLFQDGTSHSFIQLQIIDDPTPEDTENFAITLESITGNANLGTTTTAEIDIEISDDPFGVIGFNQNFMSIDVRNPTPSEGDLSVSLTVDRVRGTMGSVEVQYQVLPTAPLQQVHEDITPTSDTLTFADGVNQQFIILTVLAEEGPEVEEEYVISLVFSTGTLDPQRVNASVTIAGRGMPYGVVGFAPGLTSRVFEEPEVSVVVGLELERTLGTFSAVMVYWEATGNVTSSDISPLFGSVELPHWDGAVDAYPRYNLTFTLLSDTQAEDTQEFSIHLISATLPTQIDPAADTVAISIRANDYPHGLFSIDPTSVNISLTQDTLSRYLNFSIVRDQGLTSDANLTYSLTYMESGQSESITLVYNNTLAVPDGVSGLEASVYVGVDTFLGTNGMLTLTLTDVTAVGTAITGLPPRILENSEVTFTVLEHQANARISFSTSSLTPAVNDVSNTIDLVLEREGTFGNVTIGFISGQAVVTSLLDGLITPSSGEVTFLPSESSKSISLSLSPNLLTSDPEVFTVRLIEVVSTVKALPSTSTHTAVAEPQGVVGFSTDQLRLRVAESEGFAVLDVYRLFGSYGTIFVSYSTASDDIATSMFEEVAIENVDYNRTQGLLKLEPYQTRQQITVPISADDNVPETDKLFTVTLSAVVDSESQLSESPRLRTGHMTSLVVIVDDENPAGVFSFSQNKLIVQEEFQLLVITILRATEGVIFPANISVRTVTPELATSIGIDYSSLGVNLETTDNATLDQDYLSVEEQLVYSVNDTVMQVSLRILDEDIPEVDKLVLLQMYNASYQSSISLQSLLPIIISANDDSGGILRFSDNSLSLFISEDIMPSIQVGLSRDRGMFGGVSIQWQAKLSPGDIPATTEEISILSTQLVETSGVAVFVAGEATTNFTLSLKQDTVPELMEIFYLRLLADTIQPVAVLDTSRDVAMVTSLQSDFPYGAIQFGPDSRYRTVTSGDINFTVRLSVQRKGGTLGSVLVHYTTPGITQETITIGSYSASNAQIGGHYLSADGTLNFTEGRTEDFIDITILGNPLNPGETRLMYVDIDPVHPAEGGDFLRATILLTGHGNEFRLLEIYSLLLSTAADLETSQSLLTFLTTDEITTVATRGEGSIIRSILDQLINNGVDGSYTPTIQENIFTSLSLVIGSGKFPGQSFFSDVIESFSYSLLVGLSCPLDTAVEMKSSVIEIQAYTGTASQISGYRFNTNGNTFRLPVGVLPQDGVDNCGAQVFIADMTMGSNGIFQDSSVNSVFGQTVLSVGLQDSDGNKITSLLSPVTYRVVSTGQLVKFKNSQCIFWDPITSSWSSEGCSITNQLIEQSFIECQCYHLSNFAADATADGRYSFGIAMAVACGVVVLALVFSIATHIVYYTKFQLVTHLIMNLLISLLLNQITFLLASILSPIANEAGCAAIGALLHYFTLVTFLWCLLIVTAVVLVVYFGTLAFEHLQLVLYAFFGWLAPAIIVLLCIFVVRFGLGLEWTQVYGDVYGNGDLCFIPNFTVDMVTAVAPVLACFFLSLIGIVLLFLMTSTSSNEDLKYDDIYFTSKNTREVFKLLLLLILIGLAWAFSAIHLIVGQHYTLAMAVIAQIVLAFYILVVYSIFVIYIFVAARKKSYYPQEDPNEIKTAISPVSPMNVDVPHAQGPPSYLEDKIYVNPSIPDASSIMEGSYPPSDIARSSAMYTEDPEIDDLLYTLKVGEPDQDSYFQNGDTRSDPSIQEVFTKRRISIADTHL